MSYPNTDQNREAGRFRRLHERLSASPLFRKVSGGIFWTLAGYVTMHGLTFVSFFFIAQFLGKQGFGEFGLIRSTIATFAIYSIFGMGETTTRYLAARLASAPDRAGRTLTFCSLVSLLSAVFFPLFTWLLLPWLNRAELLPSSLLEYAPGIVAVLFFTTIWRFQTGVLAGFQDFKSIAFVNTLVGATTVVGLVSGAYFFGITGALAGTAFSLACGVLYSAYVIERVRRKAGIVYTMKGLSKEFPIIGQYAVPCMLESSLSIPVLWICYLMLERRPGGVGELAVYYAALQFYHLAMFFQAQIYGVLFPMLSEAEGAKDRKRVKKMLLLSFTVNTGLAAGFAAFLILFAGPIMGLYGEGFAQGGPVLVLMSLAAILVSISYTPSMWLGCRGKAWLRLSFGLTWGVMFFVSTVLLLNRGWGAGGLGAAYLIANACQCLMAMSVFVIELKRSRSDG